MRVRNEKKEGISEITNGGLQSVFTREEFVILIRSMKGTQMEEVSVTQNDILTLMKNLDVRKAVRPDRRVRLL